ncbi:hypothetical protein ACROYT_G006101 [Oculina patagonica]
MGWFNSIYSEDHIAIIERSKSSHPAKALLDDLDHREVPLIDLVNGLERIGNRKAVSIIKKGAHKSGLDVQYSGGRPPPQVAQSIAGHPQEYIGFSCAQRREQVETLRVPVQESGATGGTVHPSDPGHEAPFNLVETVFSIFFPCFSFYYKTS